MISFKRMFINTRHLFSNLYNFNKVICNFRWWDYDFQVQVIYQMLKELDKNWHKNHYIDGNFTHLRIKVLIRMLDKYNNEFDNKILTLFMKRYSRMLTNFWD